MTARVKSVLWLIGATALVLAISFLGSKCGVEKVLTDAPTINSNRINSSLIVPPRHPPLDANGRILGQITNPRYLSDHRLTGEFTPRYYFRPNDPRAPKIPAAEPLLTTTNR